MRRSLSIATAVVLLLGLMPAFAGANGTVWDFTFAWQSTASGWAGGVLELPQGIASDKFGNVYVVGQTQDVVNVYDPDGALIDTWGSYGSGDGELDGPRDVEVDRWGNVYVLEDYEGQRISVFNSSGDFTRHIGEAFVFTGGLGVGLNGDVYADTAPTITHFTPYGDVVTSWSAVGWTVGISCDQDGNVWATNDHNGPSANSVVKYSPTGAVLASWGSTGTADGEFTRPYDVEVDAGGRVYVVSSLGSQDVQAFDGTGSFITRYAGADASPAGFSLPYGIDAGFMRQFGVADTFRNRIVSFESTPAIPTDYVEVAGATRYQTAAAASLKGWPDGSDYAVVATALNWPDALSGAGLAGAAGAPLLLTNPNTLSAEVASEITRLGCDEVYVLGGEGAVLPAVFDAIEGIVGSGNVHRLGGLTRYETSSLIASETVGLRGSEYDGTGFVVTGRDFPDALAASPIAAANGWPILLTEPAYLPAVIADTMTDKGINHGYIIGGTGAVSADAYDEIDALWIGSPYRIDGLTRYETAANVAVTGFKGMGMLWSRPALATGQDFPDALAGGVLQGSDYSVMLLTKPTSLSSAAAAALSANKDSIYEMRYLGGTGVVSPAVRSSTAALLH